MFSSLEQFWLLQIFILLMFPWMEVINKPITECDCAQLEALIMLGTSAFIMMRASRVKPRAFWEVHSRHHWMESSKMNVSSESTCQPSVTSPPPCFWTPIELFNWYSGVQEIYQSVSINHKIIRSESITSTEVTHSLGHLLVWTSHGTDHIFLFLNQKLVLVGVGFSTLDVILEGRRIFPFNPSR